MASDNPEHRFDQVDWDEISRSGDRGLTVNAKGLFVSTAALVAVLSYDYFAVADKDATFEVIGWNYDVSQLDYLFAFTILLFGFYAVLPLYQNPKMTRYYWREFKRNRPAVISLVWLITVFLIGVIGPLFISAPETELFRKYQPPVGMTINQNYVIECVGTLTQDACRGSWAHPLGTTQGGRDILTMIIYGMQISMKIGFIVTLIAVVIGTAFGTVSAYAGGMVDEVLMRYVDVQQSFPTFIAYLLILYIFGGDLVLFILLFGLFSWEGMARYVRSKALSITEEEYMKATKISGASTYRIIRRHLIPNSASSIITDITLLIPGFLLAEAQLSFLGLGDSEVPSWGQLIAAGRSDLSFAPWITLAPGLVLFFTILAFNFLGDALLDALNPEAEAEAES
jgi:peptide/nickel transport system permease protein